MNLPLVTLSKTKPEQNLGSLCNPNFEPSHHTSLRNGINFSLNSFQGQFIPTVGRTPSTIEDLSVTAGLQFEKFQVPQLTRVGVPMYFAGTLSSDSI